MAAAERAQEDATYVRELWGEDPLCSVSVLDYRPAHVQGSEAPRPSRSVCRCN